VYAKGYYEIIYNNKHAFLLFFLLLFLAIKIMGDLVEPVVTQGGMRILLFISFSAILLSAIYAENKAPRMFRINLVFLILSFIFQFLYTVTESESILALSQLFSLFFLFSIACCMLQNILFTRSVSREVILSSICLYMILGIGWSLIYTLLELMTPGSFSLNTTPEAGSEVSYAVYFSFVTLTTLGYGDIGPLTSPARFFTILESLTGQIYLAVLVARLVGLQIASAVKEH